MNLAGQADQDMSFLVYGAVDPANLQVPVEVLLVELAISLEVIVQLSQQGFRWHYNESLWSTYLCVFIIGYLLAHTGDILQTIQNWDQVGQSLSCSIVGVEYGAQTFQVILEGYWEGFCLDQGWLLEILIFEEFDYFWLDWVVLEFCFFAEGMEIEFLGLLFLHRGCNYLLNNNKDFQEDDIEQKSQEKEGKKDSIICPIFSCLKIIQNPLLSLKYNQPIFFPSLYIHFQIIFNPYYTKYNNSNPQTKYPPMKTRCPCPCYDKILQISSKLDRLQRQISFLHHRHPRSLADKIISDDQGVIAQSILLDSSSSYDFGDVGKVGSVWEKIAGINQRITEIEVKSSIIPSLKENIKKQTTIIYSLQQQLSQFLQQKDHNPTTTTTTTTTIKNKDNHPPHLKSNLNKIHLNPYKSMIQEHNPLSQYFYTQNQSSP